MYLRHDGNREKASLPKASHKISKYIDYPNMKELFLSLQPRKMPASHVIPKALSA